MAFTYTTRKDGRLMKKVVVNGKAKYLYSHDKEDLEKQYINLKHLSYNGLIPDNQRITVETFAKKWVEIHSSGKEIGTIREYNYIINHYIIPIIGKIKLKDLKPYNIKELQNTMLDKNINKTTKTTIRIIKSILNDAMDNDLISKNVANNIKTPKAIKKEKLPLCKLEDNLLLKCNYHKYYLFFLLIRYTGMRKEEITALTVQDIDLKNNIININKAVTFVHNQPVVKSTKNKKSRNVYILDIFKDELQEKVKNCIKNSEKYLFSKQTNHLEMLSDTAIKRMTESFLLCINNEYKKTPEYKKKKKEIKAMAKNNQLKVEEVPKIKFTLHQLRHSFCTMLYYSGIKIKKAQELMGHSSADMVYDIYTHLDEERENAYDIINSYSLKDKLSESCQNQHNI